MVRIRKTLIASWAVSVVVLISLSGGCGGNKDTGDAGFGSDDDASVGADDGSGSGSSSGSPSSSGAGIFGNGPDAAVAPCTGGGLQCYVPQNCTTSVSGTV